MDTGRTRKRPAEEDLEQSDNAPLIKRSKKSRTDISENEISDSDTREKQRSKLRTKIKKLEEKSEILAAISGVQAIAIDKANFRLGDAFSKDQPCNIVAAKASVGSLWQCYRHSTTQLMKSQNRLDELKKEESQLTTSSDAMICNDAGYNGCSCCTI